MLARLAQAISTIRPGQPWQYQPVVEDTLVFDRAWRPHGEDLRLRLHVHRISPAETAFWHPHAQPAAMLVLGGPYELKVARGGDETIARVVASGPFWYELTHPESWHAIRAHGLVRSVMLTWAASRAAWTPSLTPFVPVVPGALAETIDEILLNALAEARGAPAAS